MTLEKPDLETRVESSLLRVLRDAFPGVPCHAHTQPGESGGKCIGLKVESGAENPIGTNLFDVSIEIEARNIDAMERQLIFELFGNAYNARATLEIDTAKMFVMPRGQAVEMIGAPRTVEGDGERILSISLVASLQPI